MSVAFADAIFWIAAGCCAVAQWFIVRGAIAAASAPAASARVPRSRRVTETIWAIVPAIALAVVLAATWRALHRERPAVEFTPAPQAGAAPAAARSAA